jgi:hypothetical protein
MTEVKAEETEPRTAEVETEEEQSIYDDPNGISVIFYK